MWKYLPLFLIISFCIACEKGESALPSDIPEITFVNLDFVPRSDSWGHDMLKATIAFKDGGADLGYEAGDASLPVHYFYFNKGQLQVTADINRPDLLKIGASDTLPAYSCNNYQIRNFMQPVDTVYRQDNPYFYTNFC